MSVGGVAISVNRVNLAVAPNVWQLPFSISLTGTGVLTKTYGS
ncbi:hypothetical protein DCCM_4083 [Desulfocucumis palustris]|uniref:Uncharacterized protein n=1 Tax=Desulfocucumis palustris TaxID=1898651 RepID=A0A2L2XFQ3_9FIRM|nr:hypothetical protein DCCM_4083 [Desulfocucumis palustris]